MDCQWIAWCELKPEAQAAWVQGIGSIAAILVAVYVPFKIQSNARAQNALEKRAANVTAGNRAIFELIRTYNKFLVVRKQFIDPNRADPIRYLTMLPTLGLNWRPMAIDFESLAFLYELGDSNLLGQLAIAEEEVSATITTIRRRAKFHYRHVQVAADEANAKYGDRASIPQIESELGRRKTILIKMLTDAMIEGVDSVLKATRENIEALNKGMRQIYPHDKIAKMVIPSEQAQPK